MKTPIYILISCLALGESAWAVDKGFSKALKYAELKSTGTHGDSGELILPVMLGILAVVLVLYFYRRIEEQKHKPQSAKVSPEKRRRNFLKQAQLLGFTKNEARVLIQFAELVTADEPQRLLEGGALRRQLVGDVSDRIRRRQREIEVMGSLLDKVGRMEQQDIRERDDVRVQAEIALWIIAKNSTEDPEDDFADGAEQIAGRLVDLSTGGAAIRADLTVEEGALLEFWSADPHVWLPPTSGRVLHVDREDETQLLNLRFVDEASDELREAIVELQRAAKRAVT